MRFATFACLLTCTLVPLTASQDIIIDNEDAGFSQTLGTWTPTGTPIGYPGGTGSYLWAAGTGAGAPTEICQWQPTIATAGWYEVSVWYVAGANRPTDAPYTVVHAGGSTTRDIDQEVNGSQWVVLGTYQFNAGTGGRVELSNQCDSGQAVIADAVRFSPGSPPGDEVRSAWCSRFQWGSSNQTTAQNNINSVMTNLANNNFNAVFFQVRGQCETYYPSPDEPWSSTFNYTDPGWDPMAYAVNAAHTRGIQLHAYINTHTICAEVTPPASVTNHVYYTHPEWRQYDGSGVEATPNEYYYMNPGIPEADTWVRCQIMHVVNTYDVDGIHFDRARMSAIGYGRNPLAVARWDDPGTGTPNDGPGNPENLGWDDFMRDSITRAMINITGEAWAADSSVLVSSAPLGLWYHTAYPGYPTGFFYGYPRGQDAKAWMTAGAMDFIVPQIYWPDGGALPDFSDLYYDWQSAADTAGRAVVPGSHNVYSGQSGVESQALIARSGGAAGHNLWHSGSTNYTTWSSSGHPYELPANFPTFPWRSTEGVIVCRVYESDGSTPITDAWVTRTGSTWTALSSADGLCAFLRVSPGTYTLTAQHPGEPTTQVPGITVTAGQATEVDIVMNGDVPAGLVYFGGP